ncbi:alpha/beta hydrolase [Candidatus Omnitrophota bacterium]
MSQVHTLFPCGDISLEGVWHFPKVVNSLPVVIVCHPHPLYGGNMSNNVVMSICQALSQQSIATFRFNFRGVGNSGGTFGQGIAEQEDVKAALAHVLSTPDIDHTRIGLAGYSFGASIALRVGLQDGQVNLLALVSPPLLDSDWEQLKSYTKPNMLIVGDADSAIPLERFQQYMVVPGADHFWWGYEGELAQKVAKFFADGFRQVTSS